MVQIDLASLVQLPGVCQEPRDETDEIATARRRRSASLPATRLSKLAAMRRARRQIAVTDLLQAFRLIASHLAEIAETRAHA